MPKHILLTGATGFLGRALLLRLARDGHRVSALVRDRDRARHVVGDDVALVDAGDTTALAAAVARADAVVNLAGEPIMARRWSSRRKDALIASRVGVTRALAEAAARRGTPLPVLLSASAVGFYGDRGNDLLDETCGAGAGFAAELCAAWERAAATVGAARSVVLRFGIVLGPEGGALGELASLARLRLAGRQGDGAQWVSWIHLADVVEMIVAALGDARWSGVVNAVAPEPARNRDFVAAVAAAVGAGGQVRAPASLLRVALGERAHMLLDSQRCAPRAAETFGFRFRFPTLEAAVDDLAPAASAIAIERVDPAAIPDAAYLARRRPRYVLEAHTRLAAPRPEVFRFFADAANLELLTPPALGFRIVTPRPIAMGEGTTIDYALALNGVPLRWRSLIERWEPGAAFVDAQLRGPYRAWWHEHAFVPDGDDTIMVDRVFYAPPLGPLGALAHDLIVRPNLERIFGFRRHAIRLRFGG